jgi:hypothetical protein
MLPMCRETYRSYILDLRWLALDRLPVAMDELNGRPLNMRFYTDVVTVMVRFFEQQQQAGRAPSIQHVVETNFLNSKLLIRLVASLPKLRCLDLYNNPSTVDHELGAALAKTNFCKLLLRDENDPWAWSWSSGTNVSHFLIALGPNRLQTLYCNDESPNWLADLAHHSLSLKELHFKDEISYTRLPLLAPCTSIECLYVQHTIPPSGSEASGSTQAIGQWLANCKRLRSIVLERTWSAFEIALPALKDGRQLEILLLHSINEYWDSEYVRGVLETLASGGASQLHGFSLEVLRPSGVFASETDQEFNKQVISAVLAAPKLQQLALSGSRFSFSADEISRFLRASPNLSVFALENHVTIDDGELKLITSSMARVEMIHLYGPTIVTAAGLDAMLAALEDVSNISGKEGIIGLFRQSRDGEANSTWKQLRRLQAAFQARGYRLMVGGRA